MGVETEYWPEKIKEPMEQSPAVVKGEKIEVFRRDSFYYLKGCNDAFTSRQYAEQAYREKMVAERKPKMEEELKKKQRGVAKGIVSKKALKKFEEEQKEWLEKQ